MADQHDELDILEVEKVALPRKVARRARYEFGRLRKQRKSRSARNELATNPVKLPAEVEVFVHFGDGLTNLYQMRQWYRPLEALNSEVPVVIIARSAIATVEMRKETSLPVLYAKKMSDIARYEQRWRPKLCMYVNQNRSNFSMLEVGDMMHVSIYHGESDKTCMVSGKIKAYDYCFVVGPAAVKRLDKELINYDVSRAIQIGRPQLGFAADPPALPSDARKVLLYAPTWEGLSDAMAYSSVGTHGVAMMRAVLSDPRFRLIYRPHPRTGISSPEVREANEQIVALIEAANAKDPSAGHLYDQTPSLDWQYRVADICISDVSSASIDWLYTKRPILMCRPSNPGAEMDYSGFLSEATMVDANNASNVVELLDAELTNPTPLERWTEHYLGDTVGTEKFVSETKRLIDLVAVTPQYKEGLSASHGVEDEV